MLPIALFEEFLKKVRDAFYRCDEVSDSLGTRPNTIAIAFAAVWEPLGRVEKDRLIAGADAYAAQHRIIPICSYYVARAAVRPMLTFLQNGAAPDLVTANRERTHRLAEERRRQRATASS